MLDISQQFAVHLPLNKNLLLTPSNTHNFSRK